MLLMKRVLENIFPLEVCFLNTFPAVFMFSLQENLEVSLSRMKTQLVDSEDKMRNYERLLQEVTQPEMFLLNYHCA